MTEPIASIRAVPWMNSQAPRNVLAIRFQAFGDIIATLPYLQSLRRRMPNGRLDLLTRADFREIPAQLKLFDHIYAIHGRRNIMLQRLSAGLMLPRLLLRRYDIVIDLQANSVSRLLARGLSRPCWSEFDLHSPQPHGERVCRTISAAWPIGIELDSDFERLNPDLGLSLLDADMASRSLVVLNPAGYFDTRNWPLERYVEFANTWLAVRDPDAGFLLLGLPRLAEKAAAIERCMPGRVQNLVGRTTAAEAFSILQRATMVLSEDSGLMHMAWVSGIPTVGLLGSSRGDWSRPLGPYSAWLDSSDLPCGQCMQPVCQYGDVRCLTRYSVSQVFDLAETVLEKFEANKSGKVIKTDEA